MSELGIAISRFRRLAGLTQAQLATAAGLSVGLVRDLEQGRTHSPRWESVEALAKALDLGKQDRADLGAVLDRGAEPQHNGRATTAPSLAPVELAVVRILGPVAAERPGSVIDLGSARRRAVLALIALRAAAGARPTELMDMIWPGWAPTSAAAMVHRSVSQLRQLLADHSRGAAAGPVIVWTGVSYRLQTGLHCRLDSADFADLTLGGDKFLSDGQAERACLSYERALALWRDSAVADIDCLQQHPVAVALNRQRSEVVRRYAQAAALAGDVSRALDELFAACQAEPLSEVLHALLITALGGTGRKAEAVEIFERLQDRLRDELGIRPSGQVWQAYARTIEALARTCHRCPIQ
jgi:DNA-binding SARP family transcriptional activator/DNA-binding XRE family transcriptional regulator